MWVREITGECGATPAEVFAVLADPGAWSAWNDGVADVRIDGPFAAGTSAVMVFPDETELPFVVTWVEAGRGYEDLTPVPDAGVSVRVRHEVEASGTGSRITYRCTVEGPDEVAAEVGAAVSEDFADVIAALGARAERLHG